MMNRTTVIYQLIDRFGLERPTAALIADDAAANGSHPIPGTIGMRLCYMPGEGWYIPR
jgi:hypothetical protein